MSYGKDPVVTAYTCIVSRFASRTDAFDHAAVKVWREVYFLKQGSAYYEPVLYGESQKFRKPFVGTFLIFAGAADHHIVIAAVPVVREANFQPIYSFGEKNKPKVAAFPDKFPSLAPAFVCLVNEKIRGETGIYFRAAGYFVLAVALFLYRQIKILVI